MSAEPEGLDGEVRGTKSKMLEYLNMALRELGSCVSSRQLARGSSGGDRRVAQPLAGRVAA